MLVLAASKACSQTYTFSPLDHPSGVNGTAAQGIFSNKVVGVYYDSNVVSHGFVYDGTNYQTIDPPGSQLTNLRGIYGNRLVGYFANALGTHGFMFDGTNYTTLDDPHATAGTHGTYAYGINSNNKIAGYYVSNNIPHGFTFDGTNYVTLDYPTGTFGTYVQGIYGTNIVGLGYDIALGSGHSFLYNGSSFTTLSNSVGAVDAFGISANGTIVGYSYDGTTDHGFVYSGTNYATIDYPLSTLTAIYGIDGNNIVGLYYDNLSHAHGFMGRAVIARPTLTITRGTGVVLLQWPTNATGFGLQFTTNLPANSWSNLNVIPTTTNTNYLVTFPLDSTNRFFRLHNP